MCSSVVKPVWSSVSILHLVLPFRADLPCPLQRFVLFPLTSPRLATSSTASEESGCVRASIRPSSFFLLTTFLPQVLIMICLTTNQYVGASRLPSFYILYPCSPFLFRRRRPLRLHRPRLRYSCWCYSRTVDVVHRSSDRQRQSLRRRSYLRRFLPVRLFPLPFPSTS
jgi:hypothetical protein